VRSPRAPMRSVGRAAESTASTGTFAHRCAFQCRCAAGGSRRFGRLSDTELEALERARHAWLSLAAHERAVRPDADGQGTFRQRKAWGSHAVMLSYAGRSVRARAAWRGGGVWPGAADRADPPGARRDGDCDPRHDREGPGCRERTYVASRSGRLNARPCEDAARRTSADLSPAAGGEDQSSLERTSSPCATRGCPSTSYRRRPSRSGDRYRFPRRPGTSASWRCGPCEGLPRRRERDPRWRSRHVAAGAPRWR
jgi:hypothetical protein